MPKIWPYIRFSSEEQRKGDSLRRQQDLIDSFAARSEIIAEGAVIDTSLDLNDLGVSGYTGKNILKGRFKTFLDAVDSGVIKRGDYLAVEAINRITRLDPMESLPIILDLLNKGVKIAITASTQIYKQGEDITQLYIAIGELQRGFIESKEKGRRVREAWNDKKLRASLTGEVTTSRLPLWLRAVKTIEHGSTIRAIEEISERVDVVREIYRLSDNNVGAIATARLLTERGTPTFTRENSRKNPNYGDFWQPSYIKKILDSRAVMGFYQPMTWEKSEDNRRRRINHGSEIPNYFPEIISPELYRRVQEKRKGRAEAGQGNKGKKFSNLFTKLAHCSICGATATHINKGSNKTKGGKYLVCYRAKHGSCDYRAWPYEAIETMLLTFLAEADIKSILSEDNKVDGLVNEKYEIESEASETQEMLANFRADFKRLRGKVSDLERSMAIENEQRLEELTAQRKDIESKIYQALEQQKTDIDKDIESLRHLSSTEDEQTVFEVRSKINERLRLIIQNIQIDFIDRTVEVEFKSGVHRFLHERGMYGNIPPKAEGEQREKDLAEIAEWFNLTDEQKKQKNSEAGFVIVPLKVGL
jgi:hypothetical protein